MIDYTELYEWMKQSDLAPWLNQLPEQVDQLLNNEAHGDFAQWQQVLLNLPKITPGSFDLCTDKVRTGRASDASSSALFTLEKTLKQLHPWRKGPFSVFDIHIDTEWHSDWKWQRLAKHIEPLTQRLVLDVGCGNGYHCWRIAGAGAKMIIGIDPMLLYVCQFWAIKHYVDKVSPSNCYVLPLGVQHLPQQMAAFDTVFSMGVIYHQRSPLDHLLQLKSCLRPGGELIIETLVIDNNNGDALFPEKRYAKMRNVWFIPSIKTLGFWLKRCGFNAIKVIDIGQTSIDEQRSTEWMHFDSLIDFLDPQDNNFTIEGYPAPKRAVVVARKP